MILFSCSWNKFQIPSHNPQISSRTCSLHLWSVFTDFFTFSLLSSHLVSKHFFQAFTLFVSSRICLRGLSHGHFVLTFESVLQCHFLGKAFLDYFIQTGFSGSFLFQNDCVFFFFFCHSTYSQAASFAIVFLHWVFVFTLHLSLEGKFHRGNVSVWGWYSYIPVAKSWTCAMIDFTGSMGRVSKRASFQIGIPVFFFLILELANDGVAFIMWMSASHKKFSYF